MLLYQVVLLTSSEDPVSESLAEKLSTRMGCKVIQVGEEPLCDLKPMVEQRKLQWNDVAYIGKQLHLIERSASLAITGVSLAQGFYYHATSVMNKSAQHVMSLFTSQVTINQTSNF